ncbi:MULTISPECIES: glutamine amidotransferase [Haloarcula]|uniref:glutamine amidotransferase n=1 Tax=Haloarcula TaxID=2237 RepID=UPI0023EC30C6|nr:glutamine amidotransferase [Halomicroarcula sp. XH51]
MSQTSALLVGESWQSISFDMKGFDFYSRSSYHEAVDPLEEALEDGGVDTTYQPCHVAATEFPSTAAEMTEYDVVVLSDIGYNTLAIPPSTFTEYEQQPNRLQLLDDYVTAGGGLLMIGGYLSFQGFNGKAGYRGSPVERALPVSLEPCDDRVERSDGAVPTRTEDHPIVDGTPEEWPAMLGYNRVTADDDATEIVSFEDDPLLVVGEHGDGRSAAFTTDCAPHWGSPAFLEWDHYQPFWTRLVEWVGGA